MKKLTIVLSSILLTGVTFIVTDCSCGNSRRIESYVDDHYHKDSWVEYSTYTDSDGHTSSSTTYHPEEWHLYCVDYELHNQCDVQVKHRQYESITNGQDVSIIVRQGKWTHMKYMPYIE